MATRTEIELIDDIDGRTGAETVRFALDGTEYEIELVGPNKKRLETALKPFITRGRKVTGPRGRKKKRS